MTAAQCRAARGLLDWTQGDLAERSQVSAPTIRQFEKGQRETNRSSIAAIKHAFACAGVSFVDACGSIGAGVFFTAGNRS